MHIIDREQVWMPLSGEFEIEVEGATGRANAGQVIIVSADGVRRLKTVGGPAEALVAMAVAARRCCRVARRQARWRSITGAHLVPLVRAGARFESGILVERQEQAA
ncbi:hypothetical protein ACFXGT_37975 [Streptomyces sp. NPDC059352]|uniref:hypothetical protein n=1 Tax=Streptomyces sp. NPDC059352 TaxID=3346810 RepID=UPI00369E1294